MGNSGSMISSWWSILTKVLLVGQFGLGVSANAIEVTASVDRNEMGLGDTFTYIVMVSSDEAISVSQPKLSPIAGFELLNSGASSESQSIFANGVFQVKQNKYFNYMLAPTKVGKLTIGPAQVQVADKVYATDAVTINVLPAGQVPPAARRGSRGGGQLPPDDVQDQFDQMEDMFDQLLRRRLGQGGSRGGGEQINPEDAFFIRGEVDKDKVFVGEQVTGAWYIYTRGQIHDIDTLRYPSLSGFWKEEIELATRLNFKPEVVGGIMYQKALLVSYALFPMKPGQAKVDEYIAKCTFSLGGPFGFSRPQVATKQSSALQVLVEDIPKEGRPANFTGAVGAFQITAQAEQTAIPSNQPVKVKLRFSGRGNAKLIDLPKFELPKGWELYDVKPDAKFFRDGTSYKEFVLTLVPRTAGDADFPAISMAVFNPSKRSFETISSAPIHFQVLPGAGPILPPSQPMAKVSELQDKAQRPRLPDLVRTFEFESQSAFPVWVDFTVLALGLLVLFFRWGWVMGWFQKQRTLSEEIQRRISRIRSDAAKQNWRRVGADGTNAIYYFLTQITTQPCPQSDIESLLKNIPPSVRRSQGEAMTKLLSRLEILSFAPEEMVGPLKDKASLLKLTSELESCLKGALKEIDAESGARS